MSQKAGCFGVVTEIFIVVGGEIWLTDLYNQINSEELISKLWYTSLMNLFKNKDDTKKRGNSRGLKLLGYAIKTVES